MYTERQASTFPYSPSTAWLHVKQKTPSISLTREWS